LPQDKIDPRRVVFTLDEDGSVLKREKDVTRLDDHRREIEYLVYTWADRKMFTARYETTYDSQGRILQTRTVDEEGLANIVRYSLDERGDPVVATHIDSDGEIDYVTRSRYDGEHHLLSERTGGNGPGDTTYLKYDDRGRLIERISGQGEARTVLRYTYDEEGRPISYLHVIGSSPERTWTGGYSYWPSGLIKEAWTLDEHGVPTKYSSYAYDERKHHRQEWVYTRAVNDRPENFVVLVDGHLTAFGETNGLPLITYTYDAHGNWVKAIETRLSSPSDPSSEREVTSITYRQIEYR
jgi:YD repeat-containing protein